MEPLRQAPAVIPQIIMSLCAVSIVTYNKLSEIMTPFHGGNKIRPRINVTTDNKTFNWLFDTGAAVTCMNTNSFCESFDHSKPKQLKKCLLHCSKWLKNELYGNL
jgi:Retroviral aspartyl protease